MRFLKPRHFIGLLLACAFAGVLIHYVISSGGPQAGDIVIFEGVAGPQAASRLPSAAPTEWHKYRREGLSRFAVLLTQTDSAWLPLVHGLETVGVPFTVTTDPTEALQHKVVFAYPIVSGKVLQAAALQAMAAHVHAGGTLLASNVAGGGLHSLFGVEASTPSRQHTMLKLEPALAQGSSDPAQTILPFASQAQGAPPFGTNGYPVTPDGTVLARFDDGLAAIVERKLAGGGRAVALGFDPGFLLQRAYGRRLEGVAPQYANGFSPTVDVVLRILKRIYRAGQPGAVTLGVVPDGKPLAVVVSHDIDYNRSIVNAVEYAAHERSEGFAGTHFIQTKYIRDWNDHAFLDQKTQAHLQRLHELDMEVGSHSVSHSRVFSKFELGSGLERYPDYQPFVVSATETRDGTVLGELRVSRFLLEQLAPGVQVRSFRPGHLEYPTTLPEALHATGFGFSSSVSANVSLSHLPFRLTYSREGRSEVDVYEFPITIEDELPPAMHERLAEALTVASQISRHGGIYVVLIHPDVTDQKLEFQKKLVSALRDRAWFGSLRELGDWWLARSRLQVSSAPAEGGYELRLQAATPIAGITLELPPGHRIESASQAAQLDAGRALADIPAGSSTLRLVRTEGSK